MKKILAPLALIVLAATGCATEAKMPDRASEVVEFTIPATPAVEVPADVKWEAPKLVEIPEVEQAVEAWEAGDAEDISEIYFNEGGEVAYVGTMTEAHPFEAVTPVQEAQVAVPVEPEILPEESEVIYEEAVIDPTFCFQDMECYVPPTPQEWVHSITGNTAVVIHTWEGVLPNGCDTLMTGLCAVEHEDGSTGFYMSQTVVGQAGWVPEIIAVLAGK